MDWWAHAVRGGKWRSAAGWFGGHGRVVCVCTILTAPTPPFTTAAPPVTTPTPSSTPPFAIPHRRKLFQRKFLMNSKTICLSNNFSRKHSPMSLQICMFLFFSLFFFLSLSLIQNDACKIMVGCPSCSYPSHLFMALTLKIMVGCRACADPSILVGKNLYTHVRLLGPCFETLLRNWHTL